MKLSPAGIRPDTPRPVPEPRRPTTLLRTGWPPPIWRTSLVPRRGNAMASAVKSLTTTSVSRPSAWRVASMENCQG